jgi:hypothetical protein
LCCCAVVLLWCCAAVLLCCCAVVLLCCCAAVLLCCCGAVLPYCCAVVLLCCCAVVLLCCCALLVVALGSTRIEGMYLDLGVAAGVAASLALDASPPTQPGSCPAMQLQDTNVTAVQEVLVNTYKQRIHGPVGPLSL